MIKVKYERLRTSIKEAMTLNSPTPDQTTNAASRLKQKFDLDINEGEIEPTQPPTPTESKAEVEAEPEGGAEPEAEAAE